MATLLIDAPPSDPSIIEIGSLIAGRYEIDSVLGRGGFGAVFGARHTGTGQGLAIKILASAGEDDETAMKRFFQEARVTSGLRHPNTIRVFDFGQDDSGLVFLAMELLTGMTLKQDLRSRTKVGGAYTEREAVEIAIAITRSLGEAHAAGLTHRDLKPDNVFLHQVEGDDPIVKVLDFGIVKMQDSGITRMTTSSTGGPGTPVYMSPEQALGGAIDCRSDIYSLGCMLYQFVTGKVPFRGEGDLQTLYLHAHEAVPDIRERTRVELSAMYIDIVMKCLEKKAELRYADAQELRVALRECLDPTSAARDRDESRRAVKPEISMADVAERMAADPSQSEITASAFTDGSVSLPQPRAQRSPVVTLAIISMVVALAAVGLLVADRFGAFGKQGGAVQPADAPVAKPVAPAVAPAPAAVAPVAPVAPVPAAPPPAAPAAAPKVEAPTPAPAAPQVRPKAKAKPKAVQKPRARPKARPAKPKPKPKAPPKKKSSDDFSDFEI